MQTMKCLITTKLNMPNSDGTIYLYRSPDTIAYFSLYLSPYFEVIVESQKLLANLKNRYRVIFVIKNS